MRRKRWYRLAGLGTRRARAYGYDPAVASRIYESFGRMSANTKNLLIAGGVGAAILFGVPLIKWLESTVGSWMGQQTPAASQGLGSDLSGGFDTGGLSGLLGGGGSSLGGGFNLGGGGYGPTGGGYYSTGAQGGGLLQPTTPPPTTPPPTTPPPRTSGVTITAPHIAPAPTPQISSAMMYETPNWDWSQMNNPIQAAGYVTGYTIGSIMRAIRTMGNVNFPNIPTVSAQPRPMYPMSQPFVSLAPTAPKYYTPPVKQKAPNVRIS